MTQITYTTLTQVSMKCNKGKVEDQTVKKLRRFLEQKKISPFKVQFIGGMSEYVALFTTDDAEKVKKFLESL